MSLKETFKHFLSTQELKFEKYLFEEVFPGDPAYETAPYSEAVIYQGDWQWKNIPANTTGAPVFEEKSGRWTGEFKPSQEQTIGGIRFLRTPYGWVPDTDPRLD